jgi:F0F1-type ATP synthase membrane subunit b/b'
MPLLPLIYAFLNLVIIGVFLFFALRKTTRSFLVNRRDDFIKKSNESDRYYRESAEKLRTIRTKSLSIAEDGAAFLEQTKMNADKAAEKLMCDSKKMAEMIFKDVEHLAEAELKQTRNMVRSRFVSRLMGEAKTKIETRVNESRRSEYIDEYSTLAKKGAGTR